MSRFDFAPLFKTNSRGKSQSWTIRVEGTESLARIITEHGQVGGKMQESVVVVQWGKNVGKSNETTPFEQAVAEAESKWNKQLDKNYSRSPATTKKLRPMLAKSYADHADKMTFPCYVQPKLDGLRCLAYWDAETDDVVMESRNGKRWNSLPHLLGILRQFIPRGEILDGELYCHGENFQKIVGAIKRDTPSENSKLIEYHVYDVVRLDQSFSDRLKFLKTIFVDKGNTFPIRLVMTEVCQKRGDVDNYLFLALEGGYEGVMLRDFGGAYQPDKRSSTLLKVKKFQEEEFEIVGVEQGKGKAAGQATFICKTADGNEFRTVIEGDDTSRRKYWEDRDLLIGKSLTVRFFEWSSSEKSVPRFPVGKVVRDYE